MPDSNDNLVKTWLLVVASLMEGRGGTMLTPTEAAFSIVRQHVPRPLRAAVAGAMPILPTDDMAEAVKIIREAARHIK